MLVVLVHNLSYISIHAPARGATIMPTTTTHFNLKFQSTPPRGGRPALFPILARSLLFQSTPPRGGRQAEISHFYGCIFISIHAPARGATRRGFTPRAADRYFNPRPREGGD